MGIPSYFSYIVKQHNNNVIYKNINAETIGYLFIDSNSIIYDVYNKLIGEPGKEVENIETAIIDEVGNQLDLLIEMIKPTIKTFIAFDGICPYAKMKHQKMRRLKSYILKELPSAASAANKGGVCWDTTNITPGTPFMNKLTATLNARFIKYGDKVYFSGSDIIGEGETKICEYIRATFGGGGATGNKLLPKVAFYGLDNDIIMLSILHLCYCENIFVFREEIKTPPVEPSHYIYLNIRKLVESILYEMDCMDKNIRRVVDYVFICFFLGNDFLPKFPSIQIRTHGITLLLDTYRKYIGKYNGRFLVNYKYQLNSGGVGGGRQHHTSPFAKGGVINWGWVSLFIQKLAENEQEFLILETDIRDKIEYSLRRGGGATNPLEDPENMPILYREVEKYIDPRNVGWEWRYYNSLFIENRVEKLSGEFIKGVCINYLEGLEWTFRYYTGNCPDWRWVYLYEYSPLLQDLILWVPRYYNWEFFMLNKYKYNPYNAVEQLEYVMPPIYQSVEEKRELIRNVKWKWAYCRYLWESHLHSK